MRAETPTVAVIGAGAWGTALAAHLAAKPVAVHLWAYEKEVVESITRDRENRMFLPGVPLPDTLSATSALREAVNGADALVFAVPSHVARCLLRQLAPIVTEPVPFISATKGIEEDTLALMTQVMTE